MEAPRARAARLEAPKAEQLRAWHGAARLRIRHADDLQGPYGSPVAFVLYRDALRLLARASLLDETPDAEITDEAALAAVPRFLEAVPEETRTPLTQALELLGQQDPLAFDHIPDTEVADKRLAVEDLLRWMLKRVEARTPRRLKIERGARWVGAALLALWLLRALFLLIFAPPNLALNKSVTASSHYPGTPDPSALVDGVAQKIGVHTTVEPTPWVEIDLGGVHNVRTIRVKNRTDGFFDEGLPLVVEVAESDDAFVQVGERTTHYDTWDLDVGGKPVSKIKFRVPHHGYIALGEVEVYGR
ncbi:MAG TPA: discoidin domain-containing protein [Polyangiaceae bacterium]